MRASQWSSLLAFSQKHPDFYVTLGLHPYFLGEHQTSDLAQLEKLLDNEKVIGIGECGLDFYFSKETAQRQVDYVKRQLLLAKAYQLPLVIHSRKANDELYGLLKRYQLNHGGIIHAFSGSLQQAERFIALGFKLGFGGAVTFERAQRLRRVLVSVPLEAIVLETDSPDMTPSFAVGEVNRPDNLLAIAVMIAKIKKIDLSTLAETTTKTVRELFNIGH